MDISENMSVKRVIHTDKIEDEGLQEQGAIKNSWASEG